MSAPITDAVTGSDPPPQARRRLAAPGGADQVFRAVLWEAGAAVLALMAMVGLFLFARAGQALRVAGLSFLTTSAWEPDSHHFGIAAVLTGTVLIAIVAIVIAVPLATGMALYISEYAPRAAKRTLISMVDLMAAVPSVVYGLWGFFYLQGQVVGVARWLTTYFGWIPIFRVDGADPRDPLASNTVYTSSTLIAAIVVALMVIPITCSIMREAFSQAPAGEREGAYALGATRWGPGCGGRYRTGCASPAARCPAASSSGCASRGRSRYAPGYC